MVPAAVVSAVALFAPPSDLKPYDAFADRLEAAVHKADPAAYPALFDPDVFAGRVWGLVKGRKPDGMRAAFTAGLRKGWPNLVTQLAAEVQSGGGFRKLRVRTVDGEPRALFRMVPHGGGVNYLDFALTPARDGGPRVADFHTAMTGELWSQTTAPMVTRMVREAAGSEVGVVEDDGVFSQIGRLADMNRLTQDGRPRDALAEWDKLPAGVKKLKAFAVVRLRAASNLSADDPDVYRAVLDDYRKRCPNDPAAEFLQIDALLLRKEYAAARTAVDRLDKVVGGDSYLDVLRAGIFCLEEKPAEAKRAAERAARAEPTSVHPQFALADAAATAKDYPTVVRALTRVEAEYGRPIGDLSGVPMYAGFLASPEGKAWLGRDKK